MGPLLKPKDKTSDGEAGAISKPLVILAKPPDKGKTSQNQADHIPNSPTILSEPKLPTALLKKNEISEQDGNCTACPNGTVSPVPSQNSIAMAAKEDGFVELVKSVTQRVYHIHQKPCNTMQNSECEQKLIPPPEMPSPVKLVDESLQWCDSAFEYLHDASDYYVIGVLGLQGTGKSTVMSILSGLSDDKRKCCFFKVQNNEHKERGEHCTTGIDIFVTNQRLILLDTQPVLSASVMDHMIQCDKKVPAVHDYHSVENALHMQSLHLAAFLMAVCHTVISVQDWFIDPNYIRFLLSAEMLKPSTPINHHDLNPLPEETSEYYPYLVFVSNKSSTENFTPSSVREKQKILHSLFRKSKLKCTGSVNLESYMPKSKEEYRNYNLFLLPDKDASSNSILPGDFPEYKGHAGFHSSQESLSHQIMSMPRTSLTHTALSEKNWFHYAARIWDTVRKSNLFLDYNRLLP